MPDDRLTRPSLVFAFTGQGAQYPAMAARMAEALPGYRARLEKAAVALLPYTGVPITEVLLHEDARIHQTGFTQPALFAVEYALCGVLAESGIEPSAVIGHSVGEFAAAVAAGALTLEDAALLVARRGALMQRLPAGGGMLAVAASAAVVGEFVDAEPSAGFAAYNGRDAVTLSGELSALARIADALAARGIRSTELRVSHAFHSKLMCPMVAAYVEAIQTVRPAAPDLPFYSTVHGRLLSPPEHLDTQYWALHVTAPVAFVQAADALLTERRPDAIFEIGPKPVLTGLLRKISGPAGPQLVPLSRGAQTDPATLLDVIERWARG